MPALNKIRMTNLSYNYGHNCISDVTLDLEQTNTLLSMENGGGKSVMTQMLLVHTFPKRNGTFPSVRFSITSPVPTRLLLCRNG